MCCYVHNTVHYKLYYYIEIVAINISTKFQEICILAVYRAPSGNFTYFLRSLYNLLKNLFSPPTCLFICGDCNVNYLLEKEQKRLLLDNLLRMYNLKGKVDFSMRIKHSTVSAIDNFIIDISQLDNYSVKPFSNDLSDHDAQILTIKIPVQSQT